MTDTLTDHDTYAQKIAKLLSRAEHPNTPEPEADACIAKAQELMIVYSIDQELIDKARGKQRSEKIVNGEPVDYAGSFRMATFQLGWAVAQANNVRGFRDDRVSSWQRLPGEPQHIRFHPIGFESDIERFRLLDTSLQLQCAQAARTWWKIAKTDPTICLLSGTEQHKARRQFIFSFAQAVRARLDEARRLAEREAAKHETERTGATGTVATESVALVLRDRKQQVDDWFDEQYGRSTRTTKHSYSGGHHSAREAGHAAGKSADLGGKSVSSRKALGR